VKIVRQGDGRVLAQRVLSCASFFARLRGLIGKDSLEEGEGMLLKNCSCIHTCFLRFPIDAVYLAGARSLQVIAVDRCLPQWRFGRKYRQTEHVLELPANSAHWVKPGDILVLEP
jgi:uncharacterized membrane protein (UPF0127 family)